jgi:LmbE family N-acetylglucosaminyl deacetylase
MGLETAKIRENELKNAMNITGCSYEIWNFNEKKIRIEPKTISAISKKIIKVLDEYKNIKTIYTHNEYGEYGHVDHIRMHQIMKKVLGEYYANKNSIPDIYQFYPNLNYNSEDRFENILWIKESERRKIILDCYKTQTMQKYRNIQLNFIPFIIS